MFPCRYSEIQKNGSVLDEFQIKQELSKIQKKNTNILDINDAYIEDLKNESEHLSEVDHVYEELMFELKYNN